MKLLIFIVSIIFTMIALPACDKLSPGDKMPACEVEDPLDDLAWLKEIKFSMEVNTGIAGGEIIQYTYEEEIVFWVDNRKGYADNMIVVYDCEGELICQFGGIAGFNTCPDFENNISDKIVLFSP